MLFFIIHHVQKLDLSMSYLLSLWISETTGYHFWAVGEHFSWAAFSFLRWVLILLTCSKRPQGLAGVYFRSFHLHNQHLTICNEACHFVTWSLIINCAKKIQGDAVNYLDGKWVSFFPWLETKRNLKKVGHLFSCPEIGLYVNVLPWFWGWHCEPWVSHCSTFPSAVRNFPYFTSFYQTLIYWMRSKDCKWLGP